MVLLHYVKKWPWIYTNSFSHAPAIEHQTPVLVVGGGPSGLIAALQLARHGINCMLVERNLDTTKWPKMDVTNCRTMELFNRLGISNGLREQGVAQDYSFDVLFSTGLADGGKLICKWDLPSPNAWRERIRSENDGSMPREPYQRCSQAIFEAWLKPRIQAEPLIDAHFGIKFESLLEKEDSVECHLTDVTTNQAHIVRSQYVIGCDGAGSRVRKEIGSDTIGGPVPMAMFLVHFKSRDLTALHRQGQFWHIFFMHGGVIIAQDEVDTWTTHLPITLDTDWRQLDPEKAIYDVLGGFPGSFPIKVDQILVKSSWRPNICITDKYRSKGGRIFLTGDAAHQNIPTGGYGMNTAVGDSFDIGWKLAAILRGYGGEHLLKSYEIERQPVAIRNIEHSGTHWSVHQTYIEWIMKTPPGEILSQSEDGVSLRTKILHHVLGHDGENKDHGVELGYRCNGSPVIVPDPESAEPKWSIRDYVASTWPGARAPHVYLADGKPSIHDLFGPDFTIVDFSKDGSIALKFEEAAARLKVPLKQLLLPNEEHVRKVWERQAVLVRPDDFVAWRAPSDPAVNIDADHVLKVATGQEAGLADAGKEAASLLETVRENGFTGTLGNVDQSNVEGLAEFQK